MAAADSHSRCAWARCLLLGNRPSPFPMRPICFIAAVVLLASAAPAFADLVAPNTLPLSGLQGTIFRPDGGRQYQEYIAVSQFTAVTQPQVITGLQVSLVTPTTAWPSA